MRQKIDLNDGWLFTQQFTEALLSPETDEASLTPAELPHTVKELPFHYFDESEYQMVSGYRRHLQAPEAWRGKRVSVTFQGAAHEATVYINGEEIARHSCGYTAFTAELTGHLRIGEDNLLCVRLDSRESLNIPPFGFVVDYMTYGGLYREAYLEITDALRMEDLFLYAKRDGQQVRLQTSFCLSGEADRDLRARVYLVAEDGARRQIADHEAKTEGETSFETDAFSAELWSPEHPVLYTVAVQLLNGDTAEALDEQTLRTGIRFPEFRTDGFYLNGEKIKIRGLNRHQSYPYTGYAMPESMQRLDAKILKEELAVNAVRTSHYPQSHHFLNACDELGLLVFTEIPGWQHIGDAAWKDRAVENTKEMVLQYRNHPSIILWGVRINESPDDDEFYRRTNEAAHRLDPSRPTGGVRAGKKSSLLEDVYTYNDFVHDGTNAGCEPKKKVTSRPDRPYLISEYNGHMFPTKSYDAEEHRREHAIRHANVLDAVAQQEDIAGSFGWCMFDYNTHRDFGSGDRICYHGVMDMFRNPKQAAFVYACQRQPRRAEEVVLELSSTMDIGEHPACNRGQTWIYTNADSVRMYKNDRMLKEYFPADSPYKGLSHGPILIDEFVGSALEEEEDFKPAQAAAVKEMMNHTAMYGMGHLPPRILFLAAKAVLVYHMNFGDAVRLYNKYVGDWGGTATTYRFEAVYQGQVVKTLTKAPSSKLHLHAEADHTDLTPDHTYDAALIRIRMEDEYGNLLPFWNDPIRVETEGPLEIIGPKVFALQGGMGGTYVRTTGGLGAGALYIRSDRGQEQKITFTVKASR
ncbi:MAG: glycoside hydrolase family 2 protein [Lachnospiraceae bacterium]|nr:glycoside hydrolase family 2 protein [Lachnospiraceae bacterium]